MESITIEVAQGKYSSSKEARNDGQIPMVYYAKGIDNMHFTTEYQDFRRAFIKAGKSAIITLKDGKDEYQALVHQVQYDPISDNIIHIDLMAIKKGQKISTDVPIVLIGESIAVREQGGTLMTSKDKINIECLPKDLPHEIEVDISSLVDFHASLTVGDIKVPDTITILDAPDISIASVSAPREEEEEVVAEAPAESETPTDGEAASAEGGEATTEGNKASE